MKRPNGTGTVYKQKGNRRRPWIAKKNGVVLGYYETKKDALTALERLSGRDVDERYNMSFEQVYEEWYTEHAPTVQHKAIMMYKWAYRQIPDQMKRAKFRNLRTRDFQAVIDAHPDLARASLAHFKNLFTQMSSWAVREEVAYTNFATYVKLPKAQPVEKKIFTDLDIEKLKQDGSEITMATLMMIYTGMRIGELLAVTVSACHDTYLIGGEKTEAGKNRVIPIPECVRPCFRYFIERADDDLIIPWSEPTFRRKYRAALSRLDIEYKSPHSCRHTFASLCRRAGVQPETLQRIMGHSKYTTTAQIYVHKERDELIQAVENL